MHVKQLHAPLSIFKRCDILSTAKGPRGTFYIISYDSKFCFYMVVVINFDIGNDVYEIIKKKIQSICDGKKGSGINVLHVYA